MTEESIVLENVKVDDRGRLTGKIKQGREESSAFSRLFQRIQNHFNDEQMASYIPHHNIKQNELCVGKSSLDKKWHRVRVESILASGHGFQACCFFVDDGITDMIPTPFLRPIPETFLQVPFQLKKLYLHGVTPITLAMSLEDLNTSMQPCQRWDSAAVEFIKKNVELAHPHRYRAVVLEEKQDGSLGIRLYLTVGETQFCLNERLVQKNFATFMTEDDNESMEQLSVAAKPKRTIADALKSKKISLKELAPSDGEDQHYVSEPELKCRPSQLSCGSEPERGYTTDSLLIPHRHRQSRVTRSPQKYHADAVSGCEAVEETLRPRHTEHYSDSQESLRDIHMERGVPRKRGIVDKLEAKLEASIRSTSGRSSPMSDVQSQESFPVHEQHSFKGSHSSLARLQKSSITLTSYCQTESDSDNLDNAHGAKNITQKLQTVSLLSPCNSDHSDFSHGAQSNKSKLQTISQKSPQSMPCSTSQNASNSPSLDFLKGYQSDTTHVYTKPVTSIKQASSPHMCSDTENDRLVPYNRLGSVKLQLKGQKSLQLISQQNNSPRGVRLDSSDSILPSPFVELLKDHSASNSSLSDSSSLGRGRGRGIISSIRGRGIASPSRGRGDSSPGSGRGYESPNSGRGNFSPDRGRGIASLIASQGSGSPVRGRGTGSPVRGRGSLSPVGRGITLSYSPIHPGLTRKTESSVSEKVNDKYTDKEMPESPVPSQHHLGSQNWTSVMEHSKNQYDTTAVERFSDSGSMCSDKGSMSEASKKPGRKSVLDKITNVCSKTPVPYVSDADMCESSISQGNVQKRHESNMDMHTSVSAIYNSSQINIQDGQTEIHRSGKNFNTQDYFRDQNKHASDNEGVYAQEQVRVQKQNLYSSDTESDYFRNRRHHKIDKHAANSSGTDTEGKNLVEKSATGQQVLTKARLPKEFSGTDANSMSLVAKSATGQQVYTKATVPRESSGTDTDSMSLLAKSATGQQVYIKARVPRESSGTDTDSMSLVAKSATGQHVFTKARLPKEASQILRKTPEKSSRTLPPEQPNTDVEELKTRQPKQNRPATFDTESELDKASKSVTVTEAGDGTGNLEDQRRKLAAKFTAERLMKTIKKGSGTKRTSPREKQERGMFGVENNVLVHGNNAKKPIYKFGETGFADIVSQYWIRKDLPSPKIIQAYAWPAIRGGNHVVAISPQQSGKTLAYLCPLLTSLTDQRLYKEIATGNGPYLLILTPSWRKADNVLVETNKILGGRPDLRLMMLHGGGQEENKACQLINGCEILVVTPPSLKRVMDSGYTGLQRLCHLVIDDAEEILENFGEEIKFIMREYTEVISNQRLRSEVPRQLLLFGTQWTGRIHSFMNIYPVEPLLIITSAFEASIYGKVRQITHMCKKDGRTREVIDILESLTENARTVIFASKKQDVINLCNIMKHYCLNCHAVYEDMEMFQISYVAEEWRQHNINLLVCCDDSISELKIHDASTIINFDLPSSKTRFCNRLACLRKYFWNFASDEEQAVQPISHLMIKEGVLSSQAVQILQLLKRSQSHIPQELKALIAGVRRGKEEDDAKELCSQLLAFGFCRNQWKCPCRHIVFPDLDHREEFNWLPDEGEVQVYVTHVINATHYYVRMMGARHSDSKEELGTVYSKLQLDMGLWYGNLGNLSRHKCPYEGEICGFQDRENFFRVQILQIQDMNCKGALNIDVIVKFVDSGEVKTIPMHKLYELPAHLKEVPFQAVEVFVCRVKPIDRDTEWTHMADRFIFSLLDDKIVEGKIVLRLGSILWLDPLVERQSLGETRTIINKAYVHRELITNGFADENPNHLEKLYKLCEDKVKIPKALIKKAKLDCKLETDVLPECKQYHSVVVSSVHRPDLFFIQRKEKLDELDQLMENLNSMMTRQDPVEDVGVEVKVGDFCLAEYTSYDKRWYRGRITKLEEDECEVFFADYGDRDKVPKDKVRKIPNDDKLTDFPLQGIECKLADIQPKDDEWEEKAGDVMWDLTHFVNADMKTFIARVTSKDSSGFAGRYKYVVELKDTSGPQDFSLAQELVHQRLAIPTEDSNLTEFPAPSKLRMLLVKTPLQDVPDLCAALYWEKTEAGAMKIAQEIQSKLADALSTRKGQLEEDVLKSAIRSVVKLVGRVRHTDINRLVLYAILVIARAGERLNKEMLHEDCDRHIIRCLELNSNSEVQCDTAEVLAMLLDTSKSWRSYFEDQKYVEVLYDLFDSTDSQQIKGFVCQCFSILCSSQGVFKYIMKKSICSAVTKLLTQSDDHDVIQTAMLFLLALSHQNSGHPDLERESLLQAIILTLKKANSEKCIQLCVQFCSKYGSQKRKHKTVLLELEMVPCLSRILQSDLSDETRQLCKDLNDSLAIKVPTQKMAGLHTRSTEQIRNERVVAPEIHWAQNSFNVIMSVKVKGATNSSDLVKIYDDVISFRSVVDGVCFAFTYKLFDSVMSDHSRIRVRSSEVQISMKKVEKGRWPRLLHQKQKPANLSIDFERFVDSSDSEYNDEEEPFLLKRKKKNKAFKDAPKTKTSTLEPLDDSETDTTDSLENMDDPDRDRHSVFD